MATVDALHIVLITVSAAIVTGMMASSVFVVFSGGYYGDEDDL